MKRLSFLLLILACITVTVAAQTADPLRQEGIASWYGHEFAGRPTASGEIFNPAMYTAAHPNLPFGTVLTVTNMQNNRQVTVRINDRGPFVAARIIDLSMAAAEAIDMIHSGVAPVIVERAVDTTLGPASAPTAPVNFAMPAQPVFVNPEPVNIFQAETIPVPTVETFIAPPVAPQPGVMFPAPAARIVGTVPAANSPRLYRLQVGAYRIPRNAVDAFARLRSAGLNPAYEQNGDFYRVVLAGLRANEIPAIAQTLGNFGFREAIIRQER